MRQLAAVFGRERPGEFLSEVRGRTQHGNRIEKKSVHVKRLTPGALAI